jgi:hypothetical protein
VCWVRSEKRRGRSVSAQVKNEGGKEESDLKRVT